MGTSSRDATIVSILTKKLRVLSHRQIAIEFFEGDYSNAGRCLSRLVASGLFIRQRLIARTTPVLSGPMCVWHPSLPEPPFNLLSRHARKRWAKRPSIQVTVFMASKRLAGIVGTTQKGYLAHPLQLSHELALAETFFSIRRSRMDVALGWRGEDSFPSTKTKSPTPDALVVDPSGHPFLAIEVAGHYAALRFRKLHRYLASRSLAYEIW